MGIQQLRLSNHLKTMIGSREKTLIVTGGAGFIGSNLIKKLNDFGKTNIILVDDLTDGKKISNISDLDFIDYIDKDDFLSMVEKEISFGDVQALFHLGACSSTTEWDGKYLMQNNFEYSKKLLNYCQKKRIQFLYASSASVYGLGKNGFREERSCENPINMYAFSKFQFDQYVRAKMERFDTQVSGLRYFNVYGDRESHKIGQSSPIYQFNEQLRKDGIIRIFKGYDGYDDGEHQRDFVSVEDCVKVNLWLLENKNVSDIFNVGTGIARSFYDVATSLVNFNKKNGEIKYIEFPDSLKGSYQSYTCADLKLLRKYGYQDEFLSLEEGIRLFLKKIKKSE